MFTDVMSAGLVMPTVWDGMRNKSFFSVTLRSFTDVPLENSNNAQKGSGLVPNLKTRWL